jgi:hypothetical protein
MTARRAVLRGTGAAEEGDMTQLAPDEVPESSTAGTARKTRTVAAGEVEPLREAPFMPKRHAGWELEDYRHELPHDAERFGAGLEDDRKLQRAKLIAGVLSEVALVGMLITSFQEPGRDVTVLLAVVVAGLGLAMGVHVTRYRTDGQPRIHSWNPRASSHSPHGSREAGLLRRAGSPEFQPAGRKDGRRL